MKTIVFSIFSSFVILFNLSAQHEPVQWSFDMKQLDQDHFEILFTAQIDKGWTVYSQHVDDGGPVPTSINYETEGVVEFIGEAVESGHSKEGLDPIFDVNVKKYLDDQPFVITQKVKVIDPAQKLSGYLTFMCCDDERCLPPTDIEFSFDFEKGQGVVPSSASDVAVTNTLGTATNSKKKVAGSEQPVSWTVKLTEADSKNGEGLLSFTASISKNWTVYSYFVDETVGPLPTTIEFENTEAVELIGDPIETGHKKEGLDPIFDGHVIKFLDDQPYTISQKIKFLDRDVPLIGSLSFMTCDDIKCLPPEFLDFEVHIESGAHFLGDVDIDALAAAQPDILNNVIDQTRPKLRETYQQPVADCGDEVQKSSSLLWMFIFGFGGGLLALLTPCVFPMIPLTVSFFTKDTKRKGWVNGLIYGISIVVIYVTLGLVITLLFGEEALNRLSTNWIANSLFFLIFVLFAFSFFGYYEITLPSSWSSSSDRMADKGGLLGIFFMAFTLAIVSFSCTGPIIGTALVQAATNQVGPFIVMLGFALALALPFGVFAAFPAWLNSLPKSGGWMTNVKVFLGFLELALAFKFLSVADMTNHWGFLRYELFMGIWILIAVAMALYGFGLIRFPHDVPVQKLSVRRWIFSLASVALAAYLASGFIFKKEINSYNALPLLSGIAPPATYNFFLPAPQLDPLLKEKYPSLSKCANNIDCFKDYYEGLAYAKEVGKPVLLDHTGYGCVNCRKTEDLIWKDSRVRSRLNDDYVLVSLYVDDDKELSEVLISKKRNKKMRNIGNKWADFQIVNFDQNSQPLYVMISPDEEVIAAPRGYKDGIEEYLDYLDCGLSAFQGLSNNY